MFGTDQGNRHRSRHLIAGLILTFIAVSIALVTSITGPPTAGAAVNTERPASPVKLIFIHHSTGELWLADNHGRLGIALRDSNYFVSDTNYGWGPGDIGNTTDLGHWWTWFRSPSAPTYMTALYAESARHSNGYSRLATNPGGPNEIVMFKSCFPNSQLREDGAPVPAIADNPLKGLAWGGGAGWAAYTVSNAKGIYLDLLRYFGAHPEKLFVAVVAPPVTSPDTPAGRALANWLVDHWLQDSGYAVGNVMVFDLYNVLSSKTGGGASDVGLASGNHHRIWNGELQHKTDDGADRLAYPSAGGDSHPNAAGLQKATAEFVPLLNAAYNEWKGNYALPTSVTVSSDSMTLDKYNDTYTLTGSLSAEGSPFAGRSVALQTAAKSTGPWNTTAVTAVTAADGSFSLTHTPRSRTYYRARFAGGGGYASAVSPVRSALPLAFVGNPIAPAVMYANQARVVYGYLKPRHGAGTWPVRIYRYRYVSGGWESYGYVRARVTNYGSGSKYAASLALPAKGKWRLRACHPADAGHALSRSTGYDCVIVR